LCVCGREREKERKREREREKERERERERKRESTPALDNKPRNFMMRPSKLADDASCTAGGGASHSLSLWIFFPRKKRRM
jgi:hypothetical protein